jgi:hypothetical protein
MALIKHFWPPAMACHGTGQHHLLHQLTKGFGFCSSGYVSKQQPWKTEGSWAKSGETMENLGNLRKNLGKIWKKMGNTLEHVGKCGGNMRHVLIIIG